jgi:hypothetical protein
LEAMLRIALEGPNEIFDNIIEEAIPLWKKSETKYRFLYTNPSLMCLREVMHLVQ